MKRGMFIGVFLLLLIFSLNNVWAQSGPSWLIQGDLQDATIINDFIEIPNTNIIIAAGRSYNKYPSIWKSTNSGVTWTRKYYSWSSNYGVVQLEYDNNKNIIFGALGQYVWNHFSWKSIIYSTDQGENWNTITHPASLGEYSGANSILLLNNKLYIAYWPNHPENGNYHWGDYSAMLYRIDVSDYNPSNWYWEFLMQYPELDYLMRLAEKDGKLYVFGKVWNSNAIRVFTYDTQTLDRMAVRIGTVEEVRQQVEQYQAQLAQQAKENPAPDNTTTVANPINEEAEK